MSEWTESCEWVGLVAGTCADTVCVWGGVTMVVACGYDICGRCRRECSDSLSTSPYTNAARRNLKVRTVYKVCYKRLP